jgi:hypothetical protein
MCGGCANCCRTVAKGAEKIEDDASVERHGGGDFTGRTRSGAIDDGANMALIRLWDDATTVLLPPLLTLLAFAAVDGT